MNHDLRIRIIVENYLPNLDYGIQLNNTFKYKGIQIQRSVGTSLQFDFTIQTKKYGYLIDYGGSFVHGQKFRRFFYLKLVSPPGEVDSISKKRIKIPFDALEEELVKTAIGNSSRVFITRINGRVNDLIAGSGTDMPINEWHLECMININSTAMLDT